MSIVPKNNSRPAVFIEESQRKKKTELSIINRDNWVHLGYRPGGKEERLIQQKCIGLDPHRHDKMCQITIVDRVEKEKRFGDRSLTQEEVDEIRTGMFFEPYPPTLANPPFLKKK